MEEQPAMKRGWRRRREWVSKDQEAVKGRKERGIEDKRGEVKK